jgi:hypothetical protein
LLRLRVLWLRCLFLLFRSGAEVLLLFSLLLSSRPPPPSQRAPYGVLTGEHQRDVPVVAGGDQRALRVEVPADMV